MIKVNRREARLHIGMSSASGSEGPRFKPYHIVRQGGQRLFGGGKKELYFMLLLGMCYDNKKVLLPYC